jgi:orotate phosphoribosyltransferase
MSAKPRLILLLREHSVLWGDFTLRSGKKSDLYVDVRKTSLHAQGAVTIALAVLQSRLADVAAVGGVELGAVPIVGSVLAIQTEAPFRIGLQGFVVRKTPKEHGTQTKIENCPPAGTKVAIIEDVTTSGLSMMEAITAAEGAGLNVIQAITVVDRQEGAEEFLRASGFVGVFTPLVTRVDLAI